MFFHFSVILCLSEGQNTVREVRGQIRARRSDTVKFESFWYPDTMPTDYTQVHEAVYDALVEEYEHKASLSVAPMTRIVNYFIPYISNGNDVLNIGCGVGQETQLLSERGFRVTAIDLSSKMVEHTRKKCPSAYVIQGEFLKFNFHKRFDAIFAFAFIHLFPKSDANKVLKKMYKLLKRKGVLFINTNLSTESREGWEIKNDSLFPNSRQTRYRKHWTEVELQSALLDTGFVLKDKAIANDDPRGKKWIQFIMERPAEEAGTTDSESV